ncbi:MerR family transcriptional regulator [Mycolicibacterium brisbanense]
MSEATLDGINGTMRIGELSRRTGVSERSLRYYEQQGLLAATRTPNGQRQYAETAVDRVIHIQELFAAGLRSNTIAGLLPCMRDTDGGIGPCHARIGGFARRAGRGDRRGVGCR